MPRLAAGWRNAKRRQPRLCKPEMVAAPRSAVQKTKLGDSQDLGGIAAWQAVAWPQRQHRALLWPGSACEELSRTVRQGTNKRPGVPEMLVAPTRGSVPVRWDGATEGSAVLEGLAFGVAERVSTASLFHLGINATV